MHIDWSGYHAVNVERRLRTAHVEVVALIQRAADRAVDRDAVLLRDRDPWILGLVRSVWLK